MSNRKPLMSNTNDTKTSVHSTPILENPSPLSSSSSSSSSSFQAKKMSPLNSLQDQVKTPLHKLKEGESKLFHKAFNHCHLLETEGLKDSPLKLLAPTPMNTSQVLSFFGKENMDINFDGLVSGIAMSPGVQESSNILKVKIGMARLKEETYKHQESPRNESLLLDSTGLKVNDCSACLTALIDQEWSDCREELSAGDITENDASSGYIDAYDKFQEEEDRIVVGGLCKGLSKMSLKGKRMAGFTGKHTRFFYGSDDEMKEVYDVDVDDDEVDSYYDCKSNVGDDDYDDDDDDDDDDDVVGKERGLVWELYKGFSLKSLTKNTMHEFLGKHTRFAYNDEIEGEGGVIERFVEVPDMFCI